MSWPRLNGYIVITERERPIEMYSTLSGDLSRFTTVLLPVPTLGSTAASANKLIWPSACTLYPVHTKYNNTSASLQAMSYETKYRKPSLGHCAVCVFSLCVYRLMCGSLRVFLLLWISIWACFHSCACIINNWGLLNWFPPSVLEQATYIITIALSVKKKKKKKTFRCFSFAAGYVRPVWYLIWGWMSEMTKGGECGGGGRFRWRSSHVEEGWMCQRLRLVKDCLTFDQSKSD